MQDDSAVASTVTGLEMGLRHERFMRTVIGELAETLGQIVGVSEAEGFVALVGQRLGRQIGDEYRSALGVEWLQPEHLPAVLVDLKRRIHGDFHVISADSALILLGNRRCPFGDQVVGRPALCMMTSNVFGVIAADTHGYARVHIEESIAEGHDGCRVRVALTPDSSAAPGGREYFHSRS